MLTYDEVLETSGIRVPFVERLLPPRVERPLRNNRLQSGEVALLQQTLRAGDRVLILGVGPGLLTSAAAGVAGTAAVTGVEPHADMADLAGETHRLNGLDGIDIRIGHACATDGPPVEFIQRSDFWSSSVGGERGPDDRAVPLPRLPMASLLADCRPDVLALDAARVPGDLFDGADLSGLRCAIVTVPPKLAQDAGVVRVLATLAAHGLTPAPGTQPDAAVRRMLPGNARPHPFPPRSFRPLPADPRVYIATCMKDEGPFILEWIAWHRAMGVTDITVFTNDCSDGTDLMLDRLAERGLVQHLPNPAFLGNSMAFQPMALAYAHLLPAMRAADVFISMDVDEFLNVTTGDHSLPALFAATGTFDVISVSEVNHGCNGQEHYTPGWMTEQFPGHQTTTPGKMKARRGVKSIVRLSDRVEKLRNHRPDFHDDRGPIRWLDGSGRLTGHFMADRSENGHDSRGTFGLVRLEHFPLRSLDSYLAKMYRGDVVVTGKQVSRTYWRVRNRMDEFSTAYDTQLQRAKEWHATHLASDKPLMRLHDAACNAHAARIDSLVKDPVFKERRDWALREAWGTGADDDTAEAAE